MRGALLALLFCSTALAREEALVPAAAPPKLACGSAGAGWRTDDEAGFTERVQVADLGVGCAHTQLLRWRFVTTESTPRAILTLRARYQHGFVAWLDGKEIARRRVATDAPSDSLSTEVHGPEWERIALLGVTIAPGTHVLAVEAHPRTAGREPSFDAELVAGDGPRIVKGPYLLHVDTQSARLAFETDEPSTATVEWGAGALSARVSDGQIGQRHVVTLTGLRAATSYGYRVHVNAAGVEATTDRIAFHTQPAGNRPLHVVLYGDVRSGHDVHAEVARAILAEDPDLALSTGDLVDMGSDEADWDKFFEIAAPLLRSVPVYVAEGNHDYARGGRGETRFRQLFGVGTTTWRSFDIAGVHFIALDSDHYRAPEQLAWLRSDLAASRGTRATFVFTHEGPFSSGMHGDSEIMKAQYVPLLEQASVTMILSGHDHDYERGKVGKLEYIVSGGGGAELRTQRCGVPGRKPCPPRMAFFANEHNYVVLDVLPKLLRVCPKRTDGSAIEACFTRPLSR